MRKTLIVLTFALSTSCAEPHYEFRGFTDVSTCHQVLQAELKLGGSVESTTVDDSLGLPTTITRISTKVVGQNAVAGLICLQETAFYSIYYVIGDNDPAKTEQIADQVLEQATLEIGEPYGRPRYLMGGGRVINFYYGDGGLVTLYEGINGSEDGEHNVGLMVCPGCVSR